MAIKYRKAFWPVLFVLVTSAAARGETRSASLVDAEFEIADDGDLLLLPVTLDRTSVLFCLDTGSSVTVCDSSLKNLLGTTRDGARRANANGKPIQVDEYTMPVRTKVGPLPLGGVKRIATVDLRSFRDASGCDVWGFLGMDFLSSRVVQIDIASGKIRFLRKCGIECGTPIDLSVDTNRGGLPTVVARLDRAGSAEFAVDTGCSGLASGTVSPQLFTNLKALGYIDDIQTLSSQSVAENRGVYTGTVKCVEIVNSTQVQTRLAAVGDNALGLGFWSRYVVTFDFPNRKAYLKQSSKFSNPEPRDLSGLKIVRRDGDVVVEAITPRSVAAKCGFQTGDVLLLVDDLDVTKERLHKIRLALCKANRSVNVVARRGGTRFTYGLDLAK